MKTIYYLLKLICILCLFSCISCTKAPYADFSYGGALLINEPVEFINYSRDADEFTWDFGDDSESVEISPVHCYADTGRYCVTLTASGRGGIASVSKFIRIKMILLNDTIPPLCKKF